LSDDSLLENDKASENSEVSIDVLNKNFIAKDLKNEPEIEIGLPEDRIVIPDKPIFTEIYSISDAKEPIQIIHSDARNTIDTELAEKYVQNAYDSGYEDCREVANLNAQTKVNEAHKNVRRIDKLMLELRKHYANKLLKFNEVLIDLSCAIAEVIIENEVQREDNIVIKQIQKAINELNDDAVFSIVINPEDEKILEETKSALFNSNRIDASKSFAATVISTDESIKKGGCILKTSAGNIDATIDTQLKKIREEITLISEEKKTNKIPFVNENIPEIEAVSEQFLKQIDKTQINENDETVEDTVEDDDISISDEGFVGK
jgi:flagellar biosynthesis/type III secretory pathway protein FliH